MDNVLFLGGEGGSERDLKVSCRNKNRHKIPKSVLQFLPGILFVKRDRSNQEKCTIQLQSKY